MGKALRLLSRRHTDKLGLIVSYDDERDSIYRPGLRRKDTVRGGELGRVKFSPCLLVTESYQQSKLHAKHFKAYFIDQSDQIPHLFPHAMHLAELNSFNIRHA